MILEVITDAVPGVICDAQLIGIDKDGRASNTVDGTLQAYFDAIRQQNPDCGNYGEITSLYIADHPIQRIVLVGLGSIKDLTQDKIRTLMGSAVRSINRHRAAALLLDVGHYMIPGAQVSDIAQAIVEGALLGTYEFKCYKTDSKPSKFLDKVFLQCESHCQSDVEWGLKQGRIVADSVNFCRDLVNHPSHYLTPSRMVDYAALVEESTGLELTVLDQEAMRQKKMNALLAVAKGSEEPPRLIVFKYKGNPDSQEMLAFVGKGVTFDSGGISLKPSEGMGDMKDDMAGAAAVMAAMKAIGQLKPRVNILAVLPCVENMPSGRALKPGDVVTSMSGKTIEIITTDAEGRLILADAITYAIRAGATRIVDIATLTGACVVALGKSVSGVITNDSDWCKQLLAAAQYSGEKMWELPGFDDYTEQIKSDIADMKNSGGRWAGAITAGKFIEKFVEKRPWVHIDIAGTVTVDKDAGYNVKGATGIGVRTFIRLVLDSSYVN
ncbi:leucyl aminopeptidase [Acetonema longum]|uniref:Probable cytosol aminopeptidase n=1 Tax=Acetonema longum DSM 6540 TaxID=1009370 RepID=F7NPD8_9FIRM|nr:leucyl aminopeptidase [Acetonema longum]EGO62100.1 leucyl aminopeptidase [Acetonema longum DSM 6540]